MVELLYSDRVQLRFSEDCNAVYVWTPYNEGLIAEIKQAFNSPEALDSVYGLDPGAEWDSALRCWIIHTGWIGCEDWLDKLIEMLNKYFPSDKVALRLH